MAGYKDEEIEAEVSRYVQSTVKIQTDPLGPVDLGAKFTEVIALFSSTLTYDPNAIFYLIYLATNRLNKAVANTIEYVEDIEDAVAEVSKTTKDVSRTTLLGDAAAALLTVDQILTNNNAISSRAFDRYKQAINDFTSVSLAPNIKDAGEIVRPPQLARSETITTLSDLSDAYEEILEVLAQIQLMLGEFLALNLGVVAIRDTVRTAREDLRDLQDYFDSTTNTRDDKIAKCREAYLTLTAGKSVLNNFTTVTDPTEPRLSSSSTVIGQLAVPVGDLGELVAPSVECTKSGPWAIIASNNELKIGEDGNASTTYTITPPSQPSLTGGNYGPFEVAPTVADPSAQRDRMEIDSLSPTITLTAGAGRTAAQIVSDISSWITANYPGDYSASVSAVGGKNYVKITKTKNGIQRLRMTADDATDRDRIIGAYGVLGFYEGQEDDNAGVSAAEVAELINAVGKVTATVETTTFEEGTDDGEITGTATFRVAAGTFASLSHADDQLLIRSGESVGYHRIVSIATGGGYDTVTVSTSTPFHTTETDLSWLVLRELLVITSKSTGLDAALEVAAANGNTTLGFTVGTTYGTTTGFEVINGSGVALDLSRYDIVVDDIVRLVDSTDTATFHTIIEISDDNKQVELDPPVSLGRTITEFKIYSAAAVAYEAFIEDVEAWDTMRGASDYAEDISELERVMNPLLVNKNPSRAQVSDAEDAVVELKALLTNTSPQGLTEVLTGFEVAAVPRIDAALRMLVERGLDRAYDELLDGNVEGFFGMDKDDAGSGSYMLKQMRTVVQSDLPVSKLEDDADDLIHDVLAEETDADYDYSDEDEDENIEILGEVPDFDDDDIADETSRIRY